MCCREERAWLLVAAQVGYHIEFREELSLLSDRFPDRVLLLDKCDGTTNSSVRCRGGDVYPYPHILQVSTVEFLGALGSQSGVSVWQHTLVG